MKLIFITSCFKPAAEWGGEEAGEKGRVVRKQKRRGEWQEKLWRKWEQ